MLKWLFTNDAKFGCKFKTQNAIWQKQSSVIGFSSSEVWVSLMKSRLVNIDTTRKSIILWCYTSWALTYLAFLNHLPIIAQYFTQREFYMSSGYFPRIPQSQQVSLSSFKRVRWSVIKTPTLCLCLKYIELATNLEAHSLSLREKLVFVFWFYHFLSYLTVYSFLAYSL